MKMRYNKYEKTILTDCDGVLLDWEWAFNCWMIQHGFETTEGYQFKYDMAERYGISKPQVQKLVKTFNESAAIGFLPVLRDAMYWVKRLHEQHGYTFVCITSLSLDPNAGKLREMNLQKMFGKTAFSEVICLDTGADKDEALRKFTAKLHRALRLDPRSAHPSRKRAGQCPNSVPVRSS